MESSASFLEVPDNRARYVLLKSRKAARPRLLTSQPGNLPEILQLFLSNWEFLHKSNMEIRNTVQGTKIFKKQLLQCSIYTINMKCYQAKGLKKKKQKPSANRSSLSDSLESISEMRVLLTFHTHGPGAPAMPSSVMSASQARLQQDTQTLKQNASQFTTLPLRRWGQGTCHTWPLQGGQYCSQLSKIWC